MRRTTLAIMVLALALPQPARAEVPVAVFDGRGHGHGVGMAQDGAYWMGRGGATTAAILGQFYPGAIMGKATGRVRVPVFDAGPGPSEVVVIASDGAVVRDAPPGQPPDEVDVRVPAGGEVRIQWDGVRYRAVAAGSASAMGGPSDDRPTAVAADGAAPVDAGRLRRSEARQTDPLPTTPPPPPSSTTSTSTTVAITPTTAAPPTTAVPPSSTTTTTAPPPARGPSSSRSLWLTPEGQGSATVPARVGQRYRGHLEATAGSGVLRLVNDVDVETYLKGMGEVRDPSWPPASLRAQAIAARTYALRAMSVGREICDTQRCQVYLGAGAEYRAMSKAVDDTKGQVLTHNRSLASAVYSANAGGFTASREEGFGQADADYPYLRPAPYATSDPAPWSTSIALADVAARLGYAGTLTGIAVTATGPSGRAREVTIDGSAGTATRTGLEVAHALRLKSTLFSVRIDVAAVAPAAPAGESAIQAPPEQPTGPAPSLAHEFATTPLDIEVAPEAGNVDGVGGLAVWALTLLGVVGALTASARRRLAPGDDPSP